MERAIHATVDIPELRKKKPGGVNVPRVICSIRGLTTRATNKTHQVPTRDEPHGL